MHLIGYKAYVTKYPVPVNSAQTETTKDITSGDSKIEGHIMKLREKN